MTQETYQIIDGIPVYGKPVDAGALAQIQNCRQEADYVALMADHHKGYGCPIGGVVAYKDKISPGSVGFDIACGNKAVRVEATLADLRQDLPKLAEEIWNALSFGVGRSNDEEVEAALFEDPTWTEIPFLRSDPGLKQRARNQLGTIGSGNHYVDVFSDELGRIWVGVHFGSRGLGHKTATEFIKRSGVSPNVMDGPPGTLLVNSEDGQEYLACMALAGQYAYAGRDWVCAKVASIIGAPIVEEVHNHHNFAWRETHFGEELWVVRKGATPARPGQKGFVGGTMGEQSVILEGVESEESAAILYSTVHGAGRVMSRTQAAGKSKWENGKKVRVAEGLIHMPTVREQLEKAGIILCGAGADEAPAAYKRLSEVLECHRNTVRVLHRLDPLIVCMAGDEVADPYKD